MTSIDTVFARIAERLHLYSSRKADAALAERLVNTAFDLHVAITTDLEESERDFMHRYGKGQTLHFKLQDYEHGKLLAGQLYWMLLGARPNMDAYKGERFRKGDQLYLFVHVRNVHSPALSWAVGEA